MTMVADIAVASEVAAPAPSPAPLRLSPVELRNRSLINDPALSGYAVSGRAATGGGLGDGRVARASGDYSYVEVDGGRVWLVEYRGAASCVEIPSEIGGFRVSGLEAGLFAGHSEIKTASLPAGVSHMGGHVFDACCALEHVSLPESLEKVPGTTFSGCHALRSVTFNSFVVRVERGLFAELNVREIVLGDGVRDFERGPLDAASLERVVVAKGNESLSTDGIALYSADGRNLIRGIVQVPAYGILDGCEVVGDRAFDSDATLRRIEFPPSLREIGRLAFAKTGLAAVELPSSLKTVSDRAFFGCAELTSCAFGFGLKEIGEDAFSLSGLLSADLPATLETVGHGAFSRTPLQESLSEGALHIDSENPFLSIDRLGGLYAGSSFLEYVGTGSSYAVAMGTKAISEGAFRRNDRIRSVALPEGLLDIGDEAFRGCRNLTMANIPQSLERIGDRAFVETSVRQVVLPRSLRFIGESALLVQGEGFARTRKPLGSLDVDPENPVFYKESGLLCKRGGGHAGGDVCLLYVGPENVVHIPESVNRIAPYAFCGTAGVDELHVHAHLHSICRDAFSAAKPISRVYVSFPQPIGDVSRGVFPVSGFTPQFRNMTELFSTDEYGTSFNFPYYDAWISHAKSMSEFAPAALARLLSPVHLSERAREVYLGIFARKADQACRVFAKRGDLAALEALCGLGVLDERVVSSEIDSATTRGEAQATACLLELRRRCGWGSGLDLSI